MAIDRDRRRTLQGLAGLLGLAGLGSAASAGCIRQTPTKTNPSPAPGSRALSGKPGPHGSPGGGGQVRAGGRSAPLVVRARRDQLIEPAAGALDERTLETMLLSAVMRVAGATTPNAAFRSLFRRSDRIGIKVGTLAGRQLSPHPELVTKLARWLVKAGVPAQNVVIWDR